MVTVDKARSDGSVNKSVQIFQSYGWRDATEIALRLKTSLTEAGYDVWLDREKLESDDRHFSIALTEAITNCNLVLALLSPHSVRGANEEDERSSICYNELLLAEELARPILPIKVQELSRAMPFLINKYNAVTWLDWQLPDRYQKGLDRILALIEEVLTTGTNFDPKLNLQALRFTQELHTAENVFVGRAWLFERLHTWLSSNQSCFMIEGATGSGKTTFAAELARRNPQGRIVAFHFCNAAPETRNPATFVESVAAMLFKNVEAYKNLYLNEDFGVLLKKVGPEMAFSEAVLAPLHKMQMDTPCYIVVDALDEAVDAVDDAAISLPQLLAHALAEFPPWLKLMVTTRSNEGIKQMFQLAETVVLSDSSRDHRMDLRAYLDKRLAELGVVLEQPARTASLIENRVTGSFQYASNVIDALQAHDVDLQQLDRLPSSLEDFYVKRAERRFRNAPDYSNARITLELLLAAREPLTSRQLTRLSGLNQDAELHPTLDKLSCFVSANIPRGGVTTHQMAHKSITDWLLSGAAGRFQIDPGPGRERILAHCREWRAHKDPYALRHVIAHLLEGGDHVEAVQLINRGFFTERHAHLDRRQLDTEDSRSVTVALVSARDKATILALARTENTWQRDGIALALQTSDPKDRSFVDDVVHALLELKL